eukprot:403372297
MTTINSDVSDSEVVNPQQLDIMIFEENGSPDKLKGRKGTKSQYEDINLNDNSISFELTQNTNKFDFARARGFFLMVISAVMTTCMNLIIKYQSKHTQVNVLQAVIMRSMFLGLGSYLHLKKDKVSVIEIPRRLWKYIVLRAIFGFTSTCSMYIALDYLPLSQTITIYYVQPIFVAIACFVFLGERLAKLEVVSVFSAMFGVILLTQPQLIFPFLVEDTQTNNSTVDDSLEEGVAKNLSDYFFGVSLALFGAMSGACVYVVCRVIGKDLHVSVHSFYFAMMTGIGGFILHYFSKYEIGVLTVQDVFLTTACGMCSWLQQEAMSMALQIEKGGRSAAVNYLVVVNAFLADIIIFGESVQTTDILGALCIVFFTFLNAFMKCFGKTK